MENLAECLTLLQERFIIVAVPFDWIPRCVPGGERLLQTRTPERRYACQESSIIARKFRQSCPWGAAMEIYPLDWPRLSGTLYYGPPHPWKLLYTKESIEIVPAKTPRGAMAASAILGLAVGAGVLAFLFCTPSFPEKWIAAACGTVVALGLAILIPAIIATGFARAQTRGPTLVISFLKREVSLPREGKTWLFDRILRWEIVHGSWVRGSCGKPHLFQDNIGELQMVVANDDGKESARPIVGCLWPTFRGACYRGLRRGHRDRHADGIADGDYRS